MSGPRNRARSWMALLLMCCVASSAQEESQDRDRRRFRAEVAAVLVDVIVTDADGRPVRDLTRDDFEIFEDGFPQTIQNFEIVDFATPPRETSFGSARDESAFSSAYPRRFIFILNRQGAEFRLMIRAKEALENFVLESMVTGDEAMVIDMSQTTKIAVPFTASKENVLRAIRDIPALRADTFHGTRLATENAYRDLSSLAESLGAYPGRKIVIFMSPTLTKTKDLTSVLRKAISSLNSANATVYSVNIAGVDNMPHGAEDALEAVSDVEAPSVATETGAPLPDLDTIEVGGLFPLAHETGGRYFINTNVFEPAVRSIGVENEVYYLLTYAPTSRALDDRYRHIRVRVNRSDVRVRARRGYFARRRESGATDIPFEITSYLFPSQGGAVDATIAVAVPVSFLTDAESQALETTIIDASGETVTQFRDTVRRKDPTVVNTRTLARGAYQVHVALNDGSGTVYRTSEPLEVPSSFGERFGLSSIVAFTHAGPGRGGNGLPVLPRTTVPHGQNVFLYFRVMPGRDGEPSRSVELECSIYQGSEEVRTLHQPNAVDLTDADDAGLVIMTEIATGELASGRYRIVVKASDPELGRSARGELELTVAP